MPERPTPEQSRLALLRDYGVLDTAPEADLDEIVALASEICDAPMALITLIDESRQWFKARVGFTMAETPREHAFCIHALHGPELLLVPDAMADARFASNPYVTGEPCIRFYAGAALVTPEGARLGTLCVFDRRTRTLTPEQQRALRVLSRHVMAHLELGRRLRAHRQSERQQREMADHLANERRRLIEAQAVAKVGSWETDLATFDVSWSDQTHRIFNTDPATFRPTHAGFLELVHPDDRAAVDRAFQASADCLDPCVIEHRLLLPGDVVKFVEERWQVFRDSTGKPVRAVGTCSDTTERRRLETERETLVRDLAERIKELRALHGAAELLRDAGSPLPDVLRGIVQLLPAAMQYPEISAAHLRFGTQEFASPGWRATPWRLRARFITHQGVPGLLQLAYLEERPVADEGPFLREERHLLDSLVEMIRGTVERREAESAMQELRRLQSLVLDSVTEGIHGLDLQGRIIFDNATGAALLGWEASELIGQHSHSVIHHHRLDGSHYPVEECPIYRTLRDGEVRRIDDEVFFRKDGTCFPVEYTVSPTRDAQGRITGAVVSFRDISKRLAVERHVTLLRNLARMASRLARIGAWQIDLPSGGAFWSDEIRAMHQIDASLVPTFEGALEFYTPETRREVREAFLACAQDGVAFDLEAQIEGHLGRKLWVRVIGEAVRNEAGEITHLQGAMQDIDDSRAAAQALAEARSLYAGLVNSVDGIVWEANASDFAFTFISEQAERLLGYPACDWLEQPNFWAEHIHPEEREEIVGYCLETTRRQENHTFEYRMIAADGRIVWLRDIVTYVALPGRAPVLRGIMIDITELKQVEEQSRRLETRLTTTLENITDAFFTLDADWRFTFLNREAEHVLKRARAELLGRDVWVEFPAARNSAFEENYRRAATTGESVTFQAFYAPLDAWFEVRAHPSELGLAVYFRDVTAAHATAEALRRSEERFRELAENIGDLFYNYDPVNNRLLYANSAYEKIFGRPLEWIYSHPTGYLDSAHPDDHAVAAEAFARQLRGEPTDLDFRIVRPDGTIRWVREHAVPVRDGQGRVERIVGTMRDVTDRRAITDQLREGEERFRLLAKATYDAVWDWNLVTDEIWWNEGFEQLFGWERSQLPPGSRSWTDFIHPEEVARVVAGIHAVIEGSSDEWTDQYRFRRADGSYVHIADRGEVLRDANGKPTRMIGGMTDLTERRRAEEKLREQAALLDQAKDAIIVRDLEHRILYWNRSAERFYGWTAEEVINRSIKDLLYTDAEPFVVATAHVLERGEWNGEIEQVRRDGSKLIVDGRWTLMRDEAGQPKSILAINTDVTERKKLEQQFLRAQRMESIGTLAGGIAHDLNNLLAPISMGVELLRRFDPAPKAVPIINNIERAARRGADLVKQVLSFARGVEGARVSLDIRHLVREIESIIENSFPKDIHVELSLPGDLWLVIGDPTQLNQILLNLCVNARDAMPNGGSLTLTAENSEIDEQYAVMNRGVSAGRYVVLSVTDSGTGMPREILDRIFDPFFTTKEIGKGTGLGLSTVLGIVRSHGGFVNVYSEPGNGSTFRIYLPAQEGDASTATPAPAPEKFPRGDGELILVVDDETSILEITKQTLEAFGYRVLTAEDGAQAIGQFALARDDISVVLTDMMMPVMDGPALIVALKRIDPRVRIIAASGLNANGNVAKAANLGVKHFLAKPYSADTLLAILRQVLTETGSRPPL